MTASAQNLVESAFDEAAAFAKRALEALLPQPAGPEAGLLEAMRGATLGGGRRLRAFLVLQSGRPFGVDSRPLGRVVAVVECVHACGRLHAGLLAQGGTASDGSDSGATGILAGDALLTFAFGLLGSGEAIGDPFIRSELVGRLAQAVGHGGMVGGLMLERLFADGTDGPAPPLPEISRLQRMKTAALMMFCCEAGAILGRASPSARHALSAYGQDLGLAHQIAADLALTNSPDAGRPTVVGALGAERARAQAVALAAQAVRHLDLFDEKAELLRAAAEFALPQRA